MIQACSGFPLQHCCIKYCPTLTGMFVVFLNVVFLQVFYRLIGVVKGSLHMAA